MCHVLWEWYVLYCDVTGMISYGTVSLIHTIKWSFLLAETVAPVWHDSSQIHWSPVSKLLWQDSMLLWEWYVLYSMRDRCCIVGWYVLYCELICDILWRIVPYRGSDERHCGSNMCCIVVKLCITGLTSWRIVRCVPWCGVDTYISDTYWPTDHGTNLCAPQSCWGGT